MFDRATMQALQMADVRAQALVVGTLMSRMLEEQLPRRRRAHAPRVALEEHGAQVVFEVLQAAVKRRRRDEQRLGRLADRTAAGDGIDVVEDAQVL
ncbi:MAG: hypothetical protein QM803_05975 [Rhodocyclaceae bacterium]